ncbi:heme-binding protein [Shewanella benthica]|uniref:GlcG/HbpS family heme-binding protein n=1 Tax=Shewanella benthica TaxID=43661 RepID=UPI00187A3490|nr:heme-binding protein [Shewanella benthica]MBE7216719.1 heme-binding protein [Shewanella benthica]MCL1061608.1 heme-binding protein [Shewanella benthica]
MLNKLILSSIIFASSIASVNAVQLPQKYVLPTSVAESVAKKAIAECNKVNVPISISVVNDQGRLLYFYRGEGTGSNTVHTSYRKAYTSATLKAPTSQLTLAVESKGLSQLGKMEDDILLLTGGLPLFYNNTLVGAIGLSGAPNPVIEEECGKKAIRYIFK